MSVDNLIKDPNSMDVSSADIHKFVECVDVHLLTSTFNPLEKQVEDTMGSRFMFKIEDTVVGDTAFSRLHVQVFIFNPEDTKPTTVTSCVLPCWEYSCLKIRFNQRR
jgi:hypothetical protein